MTRSCRTLLETRPYHLVMDAIQSWGDTLRLLVELLATMAFALSGLMEAARKRLDAVGVCVVAFLAAFGGGTLRDLLLDQRPFFLGATHRNALGCAGPVRVGHGLHATAAF